MRKLLPILLLTPLAFGDPAAACMSTGTCNGLSGWAQDAADARYEQAAVDHSRAMRNLRNFDAVYGPWTPAQQRARNSERRLLVMALTSARNRARDADNARREAYQEKPSKVPGFGWRW